MQHNKIFIGTPCYGGMITADYFKSCMQLVALAASKKIELQFGTIGNESLITRARNTLVQLFMDGDYTHLLFIDSDLAFNPEAVIRMLEYDKDVDNYIEDGFLDEDEAEDIADPFLDQTDSDELNVIKEIVDPESDFD